jgi:hypothetical protein
VARFSSHFAVRLKKLALAGRPVRSMAEAAKQHINAGGAPK